MIQFQMQGGFSHEFVAQSSAMSFTASYSSTTFRIHSFDRVTVCVCLSLTQGQQ